MAPYEFRELCIAMQDKQKIDVRFQSDAPIDYDIHYHDGFAIRFPVKRAGVKSHAETFVADGKRAYCLMWFNGGLEETSLRYSVTGP